jgi:hypothetical protein
MNMVDQDDEHLRLLSILHYVWGGLMAFGGCIGGIWSLVGGGILTAAASEGGRNTPPMAVGGILLVVGVFIMLLVGTLSTLTIIAGRGLAQRKRYTLCMVMACISCLSVPLGTALGVFTLVVLSRPSVKTKFGRTVPPPS